MMDGAMGTNTDYRIALILGVESFRKVWSSTGPLSLSFRWQTSPSQMCVQTTSSSGVAIFEIRCTPVSAQRGTSLTLLVFLSLVEEEEGGRSVDEPMG